MAEVITMTLLETRMKSRGREANMGTGCQGQPWGVAVKTRNQAVGFSAG